MIADVLLADVVQQRDLNEIEARALVDGMRVDVAGIEVRIKIAFHGRAWISLGYPTWDALCEAEFDGARLRIPREDRAEQVQSLRSAGLSTRAIGSALGVSDGTVRTDMAGAQNYAPAPVTGQDGKTYAPSQPPRPPAPSSVAPPAGPTATAPEPSSVHAAPPATVEGSTSPPSPGDARPAADAPSTPPEVGGGEPSVGHVPIEQHPDYEPSDGDLDQQLGKHLDGHPASKDDRYRLNLARAIVGCQQLLDLSPDRAVQTYQRDSDEAVVLDGFLDRMDAWTRSVRAGLRPNLRSVR